MSGWGGGYITDITYMSGWYRQQSPAVLSLACLLGGVEATVPAGDDPVHVLELGCGQGFGAMLLAASNPAWRVTAIDFNPAHIAAARAWAAESGLTNITFMEADLSTLAEERGARDIPEADFVTLHGLWSWVTPAVQAGIVRLLRDKVRPGGVVHISYNSLPAWGSRLGMQRLLQSAGRQHGWRSDRQAEEGVKIVQALHAAEAIHLRQPLLTHQMVGRLDRFPPAYLAHEFMNENWAPCFLADVAAALGGAKLEWVGSSQLVQNFPALTLTDAQRAVQQRFDDPLLRELVKDLCIDNSLRHDVFVRGARRLHPGQRDAALMNVSIGLNIRPEDLPLEADMPAGKVELNRAFYEPIVRALRDGPRRVGDLLALPEVVGRRDNPAELIGILVGFSLAEPAARSSSAPGPAAMRFNRTTTRRLLKTENLGHGAGAASYRMGTPMSATLLDLLVMDRVLEGDTEADRVVDWIAPPEEKRADLRTAIDQIQRVRLPVLQAAGVF